MDFTPSRRSFQARSHPPPGRAGAQRANGEEKMSEEQTVEVRRQWNDWQLARYRISDVAGWHWDNMSGGINATAPQYFVHAYVWCNAMIDGELAHSCSHGSGPHQIKVCITKKGNENAWAHVLRLAGPRPLYGARNRARV
jgi:hypothetical protein